MVEVVNTVATLCGSCVIFVIGFVAVSGAVVLVTLATVLVLEVTM